MRWTAIHTYYGESHVLHGISLRVDPGEVVAILGRNGMGKTTLIRSIVGFTPPREGHVRYKGVDITRWPPFRMVEHGDGPGAAGPRVFPSLSVRENLEVARRGPGPVEPGAECMLCFRGCASGPPTGPTSSPAASSRCWRSAGR